MSDKSNANEYELARKAREGDQDALCALIEQNRARLFALAYAELRNHADAQDAVASALLNVCLHIRNLRQPERMHAWMNSIVRNEAHQLRRGPEAPLHRRSLELGYDREYDYLWLAAALWALQRERSEALELLRKGRVRSRSVKGYREDFAELPEFRDVKDAPDFLKAVTGNV